MRNILLLIRANQWIKNVFIFAPLFFSKNFFNTTYVFEAILIFICFSLMASVVYIINDYRDIHQDRLHPQKKFRPLAAGTIHPRTAVLLGILLFAVSIMIAICVSSKLLLCIGLYLAINILYSFWLKYISIIDIIIVALGFVLRVFTGGYVLNIEVSSWLIILTFLLALFIVIAKRRDDTHLELTNKVQLRKSSKGYNEVFINVCMGILLSILILSYLLYVTSPDTQLRYPGKPLYISTLFVITGVFRYLQITLVEHKSGSPTKILYKDLFTQINVCLWILFFAIIIYY